MTLNIVDQSVYHDIIQHQPTTDDLLAWYPDDFHGQRAELGRSIKRIRKFAATRNEVIPRPTHSNGYRYEVHPLFVRQQGHPAFEGMMEDLRDRRTRAQRQASDWEQYAANEPDPTLKGLWSIAHRSAERLVQDIDQLISQLA